MRTFKSLPLILVLGLLAGSLTGIAGVAGVAHATEAGPGQLEVTFFDVGQGDAALYRGPCGELGAIDANPRAVGPIRAALDGRPLKWFAASHYHRDHMGGAVKLMTDVRTGTVYDRGGGRDAHPSTTYQDYFDHIVEEEIPHVALRIGEAFTLCEGADQVTFRVVWVATGDVSAGGDRIVEENDRGLCLKVEYREFDLATCGDISGRTVGDYRDIESIVAPVLGDVEVAKVNHHGSKYSSNAAYVEALSAQVGVVSVGRNAFGHPDPDVLDRWKAENTALYQTGDPSGVPLDGDVTIRTPGVNGFTASTRASGKGDHYALDENRISISDAAVIEGDQGDVTATFVVSR
ncbi:MAG: ComEC/Rec2 family competence protein, partial [Acidimicrobiales bacterium]